MKKELIFRDYITSFELTMECYYFMRAVGYSNPSMIKNPDDTSYISQMLDIANEVKKELRAKIENFSDLTLTEEHLIPIIQKITGVNTWTSKKNTRNSINNNHYDSEENLDYNNCFSIFSKTAEVFKIRESVTFSNLPGVCRIIVQNSLYTIVCAVENKDIEKLLTSLFANDMDRMIFNPSNKSPDNIENKLSDFYNYRLYELQEDYNDKKTRITNIINIAKKSDKLSHVISIAHMMNDFYTQSIRETETEFHSLIEGKANTNETLESFKIAKSFPNISKEDIKDCFLKATDSDLWRINEKSISQLPHALPTIFKNFWDSNVNTENISLYECVYISPITQKIQFKIYVFVADGYALVSHLDKTMQAPVEIFQNLMAIEGKFMLEMMIKNKFSFNH